MYICCFVIPAGIIFYVLVFKRMERNYIFKKKKEYVENDIIWKNTQLISNKILLISSMIVLLVTLLLILFNKNSYDYIILSIIIIAIQLLYLIIVIITKKIKRWAKNYILIMDKFTQDHQEIIKKNQIKNMK
jgi:hypothetical protein